MFLWPSHFLCMPLLGCWRQCQRLQGGGGIGCTHRSRWRRGFPGSPWRCWPPPARSPCSWLGALLQQKCGYTTLVEPCWKRHKTIRLAVLKQRFLWSDPVPEGQPGLPGWKVKLSLPCLGQAALAVLCFSLRLLLLVAAAVKVLNDGCSLG